SRRSLQQMRPHPPHTDAHALTRQPRFYDRVSTCVGGGYAAAAQHRAGHSGYRREIRGTHLSYPSYVLVGRKSGGGQQLNQRSLAIATKKTFADWLGQIVDFISSVRHSREGWKR